jgi:hypothetical protein
MTCVDNPLKDIDFLTAELPLLCLKEAFGIAVTTTMST